MFTWIPILFGKSRADQYARISFAFPKFKTVGVIKLNMEPNIDEVTESNYIVTTELLEEFILADGSLPYRMEFIKQ